MSWRGQNRGPHVQRPDLAGAILELLAEPQPVLGPLAQQREHRMPYAHEPPILDLMSSTILSIVSGGNRCCGIQAGNPASSRLLPGRARLLISEPGPPVLRPTLAACRAAA